jgi:hypothetical protein
MIENLTLLYVVLEKHSEYIMISGLNYNKYSFTQS